MKIHRKNYLPLVIVGTLFLLIFMIGLKVPEETIRRIISNAGSFSIVVFIFLSWLTYVVAPFSETPFLFAGFYLFGQTVVIYHFIAAFIASITNFWIAKIWGRSLVERLAGHDSLKKIDKLANTYGLRTLFIFRVVLLGKFSDVISYAFGLTSIQFTPYLVVSTIGMIPGTVIWYYLSSKVGSALIFTTLTLGIAYVSLTLYIIWTKILKMPQKVKSRNNRKDNSQPVVPEIEVKIGDPEDQQQSGNSHRNKSQKQN